MKNLTKNILNALEDSYSNDKAAIKKGKTTNSGYYIKKEKQQIMLLEGNNVVVSVKSNLYTGLIVTIFQTYIEY